MASELGEAVIQLEDGMQLQRWKSYDINADFLTPTDGWSFTFGSEKEWLKVKDLLEPDKKVQILIDGVVQCTGWIDRVEATSSTDSGVEVNVQGRDFLKPLVKSSIHQDLPYKQKTLIQLVEQVFTTYYPNTPVAYVYDNAANRKLQTGASSAGSIRTFYKAIQMGSKSGAGPQADPAGQYIKFEEFVPPDPATDAARKALLQKELSIVKPQQSETAFGFLERNLRRFGLWIWATADGQVCISGPCYNQKPSYLIRKRARDQYPHVKRSTWKYDRTSVPSVIFVRGNSNISGKDRLGTKGFAIDPGWHLFAPKYLKHDHANTNEACRNYALQEMSKARENERVYSCTVVGHRNPYSGAIYSLDTVARIEDDYLGVHESMYLTSRTFHKSVSGGTTTDLEFVSLGAIQFSDLDAVS